LDNARKIAYWGLIYSDWKRPLNGRPRPRRSWTRSPEIFLLNEGSRRG